MILLVFKKVLGPACLLPHLTGVAIDPVAVTAGGIRIQASPLAESASCPACESVSRQVHSRYDRTRADTSIGNRPSRLVLRVCRFLCPSTECDHRTSAGQVEELTRAYARHTPLLGRILERIGLALAGKAGARLAGSLGMHIGRIT